MVTLTILNPSNDTLSTSSRPAILTYTSPIITTSLTLLNSPLFITGFKKESETLLVPVMERFEFSSYRSTRPTIAYIEITPEGNKIQVYSTKLIFVAQFEGVRYSHRPYTFSNVHQMVHVFPSHHRLCPFHFLVLHLIVPLRRFDLVYLLFTSLTYALAHG
jgi:hypothetical protein